MTVIDSVDARPGPQCGTAAATAVCRAAALEPNLGECVLLADGRQAALFKALDPERGELRVYAVSNIDPLMNAAVMSRGIVGDHGGEPTVASPLLKQVYRLDDGVCLDDETLRLDVFEVEIRDGEVFIRH